jgi:uncharacterized protein
MTTLITSQLVHVIRDRYQLDWKGIHGVSHWTRVRANGLTIAAANGANRKVVEYFAFLHDSCRRNDGRDHEHGKRSADFSKTIRTGLIQLDDIEFDLLLCALEGHTYGSSHDDLTVGTCWDADRLDLTRIGITPDPTRLCTIAGRQLANIRRQRDGSLASLPGLAKTHFLHHCSYPR